MILLVVSIANPMCCCFAFWESDLDDGNSGMESHGCCKANADSESSDAGERATDCPHEDAKSAQIVDIDLSHGASKPIVQTLSLLPAEFLFDTNAALRLVSRSRDRNSHSMDTPRYVAQTYCVQII